MLLLICAAVVMIDVAVVVRDHLRRPVRIPEWADPLWAEAAAIVDLSTEATAVCCPAVWVRATWFGWEVWGGPLPMRVFVWRRSAVRCVHRELLREETGRIRHHHRAAVDTVSANVGREV